LPSRPMQTQMSLLDECRLESAIRACPMRAYGTSVRPAI